MKKNMPMFLGLRFIVNYLRSFKGLFEIKKGYSVTPEENLVPVCRKHNMTRSCCGW